MPQLWDGPGPGELSLPTKVAPERPRLPKPRDVGVSRGGEAPGGQTFWKKPRNFFRCWFGELPGTGTPPGKPQPSAEWPCLLPVLLGASQQVPDGLASPCPIMLATRRGGPCSDSSPAPGGTRMFLHLPAEAPGGSRSQPWIGVPIEPRTKTPLSSVPRLGPREVGSSHGGCPLRFLSREAARAPEPHSDFPGPASAEEEWPLLLSRKLERSLTRTMTPDRVGASDVQGQPQLPLPENPHPSACGMQSRSRKGARLVGLVLSLLSWLDV